VPKSKKLPKYPVPVRPAGPTVTVMEFGGLVADEGEFPDRARTERDLIGFCCRPVEEDAGRSESSAQDLNLHYVFSHATVVSWKHSQMMCQVTFLPISMVNAMDHVKYYDTDLWLICLAVKED